MNIDEYNFDKYCTENQISDYLGIPVRSLQAMRRKGNGPTYYKLGGNIRYSFCEVEDWAAKQRRTSTGQIVEVDDV